MGDKHNKNMAKPEKPVRSGRMTGGESPILALVFGLIRIQNFRHFQNWGAFLTPSDYIFSGQRVYMFRRIDS